MRFAVKGDGWFAGEMPEIFYEVGLVEIAAIIDNIEPVQVGSGTFKAKGVVKAQYPGIIFWRHPYAIHEVSFEGTA